MAEWSRTPARDRERHRDMRRNQYAEPMKIKQEIPKAWPHHQRGAVPACLARSRQCLADSRNDFLLSGSSDVSAMISHSMARARYSSALVVAVSFIQPQTLARNSPSREVLDLRSRFGSPYQLGQSRHRFKSKNPASEAVPRRRIGNVDREIKLYGANRTSRCCATVEVAREGPASTCASR
jgi:hypothetical protein